MARLSRRALRFSDYFKVGKSQGELDFVDIPLGTDICLFVDPFAFKITNDPWFDECNDLIVEYFRQLIKKIRQGKEKASLGLLSFLHEPNDTHLGYSSRKPQGRAIGTVYAARLLRALERSRAVRTGILRDISDCELFIPNISHDRISDMTTNIIRGKLIDYTQSQCALHDVPLHEAGSGMFWDGNEKRWRNEYVALPVYKNKRILLVPKLAARYSLAVDHAYFYNQFVVDYLQSEHLNANSALVEVLKSGKKRVTKKKIKEKYPIRNKEFLFEFSEKHPDVLARYKSQVLGSLSKLELTDDEIELTQRDKRDIDVTAICVQLDKIERGLKDASRFHNHIIGMLTFIFSGSLRNPHKEDPIGDGLKKIDISFTNRARNGFFYALNQIHHVRCPRVFFECKNYTDDLKNPEFDQMVGRFSDKRGHFGVIVCRTIRDKKKVVRRCRLILNDRREYVIVLEDRDIKHLMLLKDAKDEAAIDDFLEAKLGELIM